MAAVDHTIDQRLLDGALRQFLEKGFLATSLADICAEAGVTTGAIYNRFKGKESIFDALVHDAYGELISLVPSPDPQAVAQLTDEELLRPWNPDNCLRIEWMTPLYEMGDQLKLLVSCADGTGYSDMSHDVASAITKTAMVYIEEGVRRRLIHRQPRKYEVHALVSTHLEAYLEPFRHDFTWEEIESYLKAGRGYLNWQVVLGIEA